jgi:hypothetical protein
MEDTWASRDLPVLEVIVRHLDENPVGAGITLGEISNVTGMDIMDVARAAESLDGDYIDLTRLISGGNVAPWRIGRVSRSARVAVGQWPSGESLVAALLAGLAAAANKEQDAESQSRIRDAVQTLGGIAKGVTIEVAASLVRHGMGLG